MHAFPQVALLSQWLENPIHLSSSSKCSSKSIFTRISSRYENSLYGLATIFSHSNIKSCRKFIEGLEESENVEILQNSLEYDETYLAFPFSISPLSASYCDRISTIRRRFCQMFVSMPQFSDGHCIEFWKKSQIKSKSIVVLWHLIFGYTWFVFSCNGKDKVQFLPLHLNGTMSWGSIFSILPLTSWPMITDLPGEILWMDWTITLLSWKPIKKWLRILKLLYTNYNN